MLPHLPAASASELSQQIDIGSLPLEPLQLLCDCQIVCNGNKRPSAHALTGVRHSTSLVSQLASGTEALGHQSPVPFM